MGRSAGESAGIDPEDNQTNELPLEPLDASTGLGSRTRNALEYVGAARKQMLESVRRKLGRLVTHTEVREIRPGDSAQSFRLSDRNVLEIDVPGKQIEGEGLSIPVSSEPAGIPHAEPGGGGVNLAAVVTVVSADSALGESQARLHNIDVEYRDMRDFDIPAAHWSIRIPDSTQAQTAIAGGDVREFSVDRVRTTSVASLPIDRLAAAVSATADTATALRFPRPAVRASISLIYQAPLVCRSIVERRGPGGNLVERERLAATAKISLENVVLIGLFRNVPVTAVSRLSVEEDRAELSVWLKPEVATAAMPPRQVSLLIGRDKSTGRMIQTVV